ncbi:TetR family transcriptional regulator [Aureimonas sp. SA4125]|uniref:class I SAM-dependent methyltransferase n=1 Tax=Aureimonas sp. SA4125 TaxID=2826993 RepID=UPI001CC43F42|nr:SAM-dependent methyltransferase [Aureimonas sp. SA4125]BDA85811.1 TetR family transcriptional regulator [Aureimonas sp. SA4125]
MTKTALPVAGNPLHRLIAEVIDRDGPISIERYWDLALFHPDHGYYTSRDPFGARGDFITAPEISQMFGELVAAWLVAAWRAQGAPAPFVLAEIGPGRGTLMADIIRTAKRLDRSFLAAARVTLVETSERLARIQAERLAPFDLPIRHRRRLADIEPGPLFLVANELFDALAIRQYVFAPDGWREKRVGKTPDGRLAFGTMPVPQGALGMTDGLPPPQSGDIIELSPQRTALAAALGQRLAASGGLALLFDYGHARSAYGDTLQALRAHGFVDPLADPGTADITSHVDFAALGREFGRSGLAVSPLMDQGEFLLRLGLAERAGMLGRAGNDEGKAAIAAAAHRLAGTGQAGMGRLFKVLAASSTPLRLPPFDTEIAD